MFSTPARQRRALTRLLLANHMMMTDRGQHAAGTCPHKFLSVHSPSESCATIQSFKRDLDGRKQNTARPESQNVDTGGLPEANGTAPSDQLRSMKSQRRTAWLLHRSNRDDGLRLAEGPGFSQTSWRTASTCLVEARIAHAGTHTALSNSDGESGAKHHTQIGTRGRRRGRCARAREEKDGRGRVECLAGLRVLAAAVQPAGPHHPKNSPLTCSARRTAANAWRSQSRPNGS